MVYYRICATRLLRICGDRRFDTGGRRGRRFMTVLATGETAGGSAPRRRGRPRSIDADRRLLDATRVEVAEAGYDRLTIDAVARRAGVARTTLYRRWPTKLDLVLHMLDQDAINR